jgi:hypothetical protein
MSRRLRTAYLRRCVPVLSGPMLTTVRVSEIPLFLRDGAFAKAFDGEDNIIQVPKRCCKADFEIKDDEDLRFMLATLRFWGVESIPREIILYVIWKKPAEIRVATVEFELAYTTFLQALCIKTDVSCGENNLEPGENAENVSSDPVEAAVEICLAHYEHDNGNIWTTRTTELAARVGQVHALKFLHELGCPWDSSTCIIAASRGHLSCLQYARENGCKWDAETCTKAGENGHLNCLKYAVDNGCEVNAKTLAAAMHYPLCIQFLREMELWRMDTELCAAAARERDLFVLSQLHERGSP